MRSWIAALSAAAVFLIVASVLASSASVGAQQICAFSAGFQALHAAIPEVVGDCTGAEATNPATGNVEQPTANGRLIWRPGDGLTGFTNGQTLWLAGPDGTVSRAIQDPPFPWEGTALVLPAPPQAAPVAEPTAVAAAAPAAPAAAPPPPCSPMDAYPGGSIDPPAPGLDPKIAALSGVWQGTWEPRGQIQPLPARLAVRKISGSAAAATYAWQDAGSRRGSFERDAAVLPHGAVTWGSATPQSPRFIFTISGDLQTLSGTLEGGIFAGNVTMTRCAA